MRAEALQLRVVAVAAGFPAQHRAREQALAPQREQPARIQIPGMKTPQPHAQLRIRLAYAYMRYRKNGMEISPTTTEMRTQCPTARERVL